MLINEDSSVFSIEGFKSGSDTFFKSGESEIKKVLKWLIPDIGYNYKAEKNYSKIKGLLIERSKPPRCLSLGGSYLGKGMEPLLSSSIELVETDVSFGPRTMIICDAHDIPFQDSSFDCVIVQAVLEHVVDPYRCVEEIYRVLNKDGLVYAETPYMQQVHGGRYDFTRFTHLGHRRLFRKFEEIDSGAATGPGMALSWSYRYFLLSFTTSKFIRKLIYVFTSMTSFFLKYLDAYLIDKPGTLDAASGYYFMGRKSNHVLTDKELIGLYKGTF